MVAVLGEIGLGGGGGTRKGGSGDDAGQRGGSGGGLDIDGKGMAVVVILAQRRVMLMAHLGSSSTDFSKIL